MIKKTRITKSMLSLSIKLSPSQHIEAQWHRHAHMTHLSFLNPITSHLCNLFSWSSEKKWRIPGIENSCWTLISSAICQQILSSLWSLSRWSLPYSSSSSLIFDQENAGIWRTSKLLLFRQRSTNKCNSLSTNQDSEDVVDDGEDPSPAPRHCRHGGGHRAGWGGTFDWW